MNGESGFGRPTMGPSAGRSGVALGTILTSPAVVAPVQTMAITLPATGTVFKYWGKIFNLGVANYRLEITPAGTYVAHYVQGQIGVTDGSSNFWLISALATLVTNKVSFDGFLTLTPGEEKLFSVISNECAGNSLTSRGEFGMAGSNTNTAVTTTVTVNGGVAGSIGPGSFLKLIAMA